MGCRNFDPEYKLRVARLVVDEGLGVPQVVRDTGVGETQPVPHQVIPETA